ncbi:MAG: type 4a pilus biogenesis protein PilO [Nitrospirae bacterium]|nr:type 4a pilus biogenesis protein PilO [Nitrospirota bacterium]
MDIRKIDLLAAGIIVMIFALAFFVFFREGRAKTAALKEERNMLLENLSSAGDMKPEFDGITREINDIQKDLNNFEAQLTGRERIYGFLEDIDGLAGQNRLDLRDIRPGMIEKGELYSRIPINISGNSGFRDFYKFLFQLENIPRIVRIDSLRARRAPEGDTCDIDMALTVFISGEGNE